MFSISCEPHDTRPCHVLLYVVYCDYVPCRKLFVSNERALLCSICGSMLLIVGLYCVLWGKKKQVKSEDDKATMNETNV